MTDPYSLKIDLAQGSLQPPAHYPYVVIRLLPAVYKNVPIRFVREIDPTDVSSIQIPTDQNIDPSSVPLPIRTQLIDAIAALPLTRQFHHCIVFSSTDCVYISKDGKTNLSNQPPSGGAKID